MSKPVDPFTRGADSFSVPVPAARYPVMPYVADAALVDDDGPAPWYLDVFGVLRRHPFLVFLALAACGACGYFLGQRYHTKMWTIEGRMRQVRAPILSHGRPVYESIALATHVDLINSDARLKPLAAEFKDRLPWPNPVPVLRRELKVESPRQSDVIDVKWETADPALAVDFIRRLMASYNEYATDSRRQTILRQETDALRHRLVSLQADVAFQQRLADDYLARAKPGTAIEQLDCPDLDAHHMNLRAMLRDQVGHERKRANEKRIELQTQRDVVQELQRQLDRDVITPQEIKDAVRKYGELEKQLAVSELEVRRLEDRYRLVPVEYYSARVVESKTKLAEAELDLKLVSEKTEKARKLGVSVLAIDPQDAEWNKLRRRLIGPDTEEFEVINNPAMPALPTSSNRKAITFAGFAAPMGLVFLALAYVDHRRRPQLAYPARHPYALPTRVRDGLPPAQEETALLNVRIQQWILGRPGTDPRGGESEPRG